jgi:hypothetical protein
MSAGRDPHDIAVETGVMESDDYVGPGSILTADIADQAVTVGKMANLADGKLLVGNGSNRPVAVSVTGDVVVANTGVATIQEGAVEDSMIEGLAAGQFIIGVDGTAANNLKTTLSGDIAVDGTGAVTIQEGAVEDSMIEGLAAGQFIIGVDGTAANNLKTTLSGDIAVDGTGAVTIQADAIETAMIADNQVTTAKTALGAIQTADVANPGVSPSPESVWVINYADGATGDIDIYVPLNFLITDITAKKITGDDGGNANLVQVVNLGNGNITDALNMNLAGGAPATAGDVMLFSIIDSTYTALSAGDTLRVAVTHNGGNSNVQIVVRGIPTA